MGTPQQPELQRSGRGNIDPQARKVNEEGSKVGTDDEPGGPVPEENRPGHRPDHEQDKPNLD